MRRVIAGLGAGLFTLGLVLGAVPGEVPVAQALAGKERWREHGTVVFIVDGDTFDIQVGARVLRIRINSIQAPESRWCGGREAKEALAALLPIGTVVRLSSVKAQSSNEFGGVERLKRTVHVKRDGAWVDIAPSLLERGLVFPFPFIGEKANNAAYLALGKDAARRQVGLFEPERCGPSSDGAGTNLSLRVVPDGPGHGGNAEFVLLYNGSRSDVNLRGWMIQDTSPVNAYFFPKGAKVRGGDYVVVFSTTGTRGIAPDGTKNDRFFYAGTGARWNNTTTDIAFLFDNAGNRKTGNLRDWVIVPPPG